MNLYNRWKDLKNPVFIIAELSANHNGSLQVALDTIKAAAEAGADAIKLQTYTADTITIDCDKDDFIIKGTIWEGKNLYQLYQEAYTPWEWHEALFECARENGLICFSSPFDKTAVDFLEKLNAPAYKIASFEITDIPLIEYTATKGKPMIISTGVATHEDIELALEACYRMGNRDVALLKCTSSYPAPIEEANLVMVKDMAERYGVITGLSDHTMGHIAPVVATCFGARIIEKHFILDRSIGGPDASFSMTKDEFAEMVKAVRQAEKAMGVVDYSLTEKQRKGRDFCRSLYVVKDIKAGELITEENVRSIRPGFGMEPKYFKEIQGKLAKSSLEIGDRLAKDKIQFNEAVVSKSKRPNIICDLSFIRSVPKECIEKNRDRLLIPKVVLREIASNNELLEGNPNFVVSLAGKCLIVPEANLGLVQLEEFILNMTGVYSLKLLPSQYYLKSELRHILSLKNEDVNSIEFRKRIASSSDYENQFSIAMNDFYEAELKEERKELGKQYDKRILFKDLEVKLRELLMSKARMLLELKVRTFLHYVHNQDLDVLLLGQKLKFGDCDWIASVYAVYLYIITSKSPKVNDQYDLEYLAMMGGVYDIATKDSLQKRILEHLGKEDRLVIPC